MKFNFEHVLPHEVDINPQGIIDFIESLHQKAVNMHSFMLVRHGKVAAEAFYKPFDSAILHNIYSASKNVTSTAVGIAISEGLLKLDDKIVDFFPEKLEGAEVHEYTRAMTIEHLLKMATVHPKSTDTSIPDWVKGFLTTPPTKMAGSIFAYDTTGTHTLCAIVQKVTGMTVNEYLRARLFDKIGIGKIEWITCPMGINVGGGGIKMTTEDMAKYGQLYLQKGEWNGEQVIPREWAVQSMSKQISNYNAGFLLDGKDGYGYKFWLGRHNSAICFGMGGQFIIIIPEKDVVFVTTANTKQASDGHQLILDSFWDVLYPSICDSEIKPDDSANKKLDEIIKNLKMFMPDGKKYYDTAEKISGKTFKADKNTNGYDSFVFKLDEQGGSLTINSGEKNYSFEFDMCDWKITKSPFTDEKAACSAVWADEKTLIINCQLINRMQMVTAVCYFENDAAVLHINTAGGFVPEFNGYCGYFNGHI